MTVLTVAERGQKAMAALEAAWKRALVVEPWPPTPQLHGPCNRVEYVADPEPLVICGLHGGALENCVARGRAAA